MQIGLEVKKLSKLIDKEIRFAVSPYEEQQATPVQSRVIGFLYCKGETPVFQRDIEKEFSISGPSVSGMLNLMEKNELITRESFEGDARRKKIVLTDKAKRLHQKVKDALDGVEEELSSLLTEEELEVFSQTINKLSEKIKQKNNKEKV